MRGLGAVVAALLLVACDQQTGQNQPASNATAAAVQNAPSAVANPAAREAPLAEPRGPIDPRSAEAAGQVVQHYGALIEQKRWREAWSLWSATDAARQFDRSWRDFSEIHLEIGKPGEMEGAAGSVYVTVPVTFYGLHNSGEPFRGPADVILRRVNDVPGSTAAQRRWHIERIDWKRSS